MTFGTTFYIFITANTLTDGATIGYQCECDEGYIWNYDNGHCDVELCRDGDHFCRNGGTCVNGNTDSSCSCPPGITGTNCETVDYCYGVDCNTGHCISHEHEFECVCVEGFDGGHCELQVCGTDGACWNNGVCT